MGLRVHYGSSRWVVLVGRVAIKLPRLWPLDRIARGRAGNRVETIVWRELAEPLGWSEMLAPVLWSVPGG